VRETDVVARLGGDEFAVLVPGSNQSGAEVLAQRLREAVEQCHVEGGALRVSVGVAAAEYGETSADAIVQAADALLYRDKAVRKRAEAGYQAA
jgi:diguanylate cyclase (GGDEF)-like protein